MSENKYHTSKNGFLTKCSASKRACPRGGVHYTQEQYDELAAKNDSRIRVAASAVSKHDPDSYYGKAEAAYIASVKRLKTFDQINVETQQLEQKLMKEKGLKELNLHKSRENVAKKLEETLLYARDVYVEEGVSYGKASFIIQDMKHAADPAKPIAKRKDRLDPDIAQKTKNAVQRLNEDANYAKLRAAYVQASQEYRATDDIMTQSARFKYDRTRTLGVVSGAYSNIGEEKALERAKVWLKAGIPPEATEAYTSSVTPEQVSIDKKGKINNVWVETANGIERVVGYSDDKKGRGSSGALITEKGTRVSTYTHYHSYKAERGGIDKVIIGKKNGPKFPAKEFDLHTSWDSGD